MSQNIRSSLIALERPEVRLTAARRAAAFANLSLLETDEPETTDEEKGGTEDPVSFAWAVGISAILWLVIIGAAIEALT